MQNRKIIIGKTLTYGASKTSATENTALNPADLADGAVGIYGIHRAGSTNLNKLVLIADGGAEVAGRITVASFVGNEIFVAMGVASGPSQLSNPIELDGGLKAATALKYAAPVLGVWRIGYNGTSGTIGYPGSVLFGDDFSLSVTERSYIPSGNREPFLKKQLSVGLAAGDTQLVAFQKWIAAVNLRTDEILIDKTKIKLLHNGTGAVFATSATVAAVNGATSLTASAAHGITAGDAISLDGDYYLTITGTSGTTIVLNRPYQGPTATIANAATLDITAAATQWGLELVDNAVGRNLLIATDGIISTALRTKQTAAEEGIGTQALILEAEKLARTFKGSQDNLITYMKRDTLRATGTYDQYILTTQTGNHPKGENGSVFKVLNYLTVVFPSGVADTATFAQSDFEDIMATFFTTFPAISA